MSITADQAAADLKPKPEPEKKRDRVARFLIANDERLIAEGATVASVAEVCEVCVATVTAARAIAGDRVNWQRLDAGTLRDVVARYLVENDRELYAKGVKMIDVAAACECCTSTVRAARAQVKKLSLFWYPRRWPKLRRQPLSLLPSQWTAIRSRLLAHGARISKQNGAAGADVGLEELSPDFACRWLINNRKCLGLTVSTVVAAGRSIGWKHW